MEKRILYILTALFIFAFLTFSCDTSSTDPGINDLPEPVLVSSSSMRTITANQLRQLWGFLDSDAADFAQYDVDLYRVVYNSIDGAGNPLELSGAILVPREADSPGLLSIQHATIFSNDEAPSVDRSSGTDFSVATRKAIFASAGNVVFLPDYIGYGITEDLLHPYQQASTLASASYDMILAGLEFVEERGITATDQPVDMIGYSEGAYATLALAELTEKSDSPFSPGLLSMGAPIFDLSATMDEIINNIDQPSECLACYGYFLYTYHQIYDLPLPLSDYFQSPYDERIADGLFRGGFTNSQVRQQLPELGSELFTAEFISRYQNGEEQQLLDAVVENDLFYIPDADVLLVHGDADGVAPIFNSDDFAERAENGGKSNIEYLREPGVTHGNGIFPWGVETLQAIGVRSKAIALN
ncbi:MAG: hypothetical protein JJU46_12695 [Balneolaceae bacterium]|nr:hypothetical protein [Balneolaceae bacterium]